jgi:ketosteroid isomerase-like protein
MKEFAHILTKEAINMSTEQTAETLNHHLKSIAEENVPAIISDYTEDSVLYTPSGPVVGLQALTQFFTGFLGAFPGFSEDFQMFRQDVEGDWAFIVWKASPYTPLGTDTFMIKDGKIKVQTFAAYLPG